MNLKALNTKKEAMESTEIFDRTKFDELSIGEQKEWLEAGNKVEDWRGIEIFEGDIVQQYRVIEGYGEYDTEIKLWEPFEVKRGNYTHGKWIAEDVDGEKYSVVHYVFGRELKVVKNDV